MLAFNALYKQVHDRGAAPWTVEATWVNIALTAAGLGMLGAAETASLPPEFTQGMAAQAASVGDVDDSAPANWLAPFTPGTTAVHAMIIIASDDPDDLNDAYATIQALTATTHVTELGHQDGNVRPDPNVGREHFGFKDGISQPGIAGITEPSKTGTDTVATGEFAHRLPGQRREHQRPSDPARTAAAGGPAWIPRSGNVRSARAAGLGDRRIVPRVPASPSGRGWVQPVNRARSRSKRR